MADSLFADVSYFQAPVDDSYPHQIFSFRSNDGTFHDPNFAANYEWACKATDAGRLACFIVYFYWRPNWLDTVNIYKSMVTAFGGPHPKMIAMIDVESGGNPGGDQSEGINGAFHALAAWLGDPRRVIGYANSADFHSMWPTRPPGLRVVAAGYGANPNLPGQIAHQYTDGGGYGDGLPEGCPPFGSCDMNSADGMSPQDFAAACGITGGAMQPTPTDANDMLGDIREQLCGQGQRDLSQYGGWPQLGGRTVVDALALIGQHLGIAGFSAGGA